MNYRKIISINQNDVFAGLDIAAKKDILVPCNMFTISVPKENRTLDIISETVFRFCKYQRDYNKIAEKCCIDKELVKFIQNKLYNSGYLTEKYDFTQQGNKLFEELEDSQEKEPEYEVAVVLFDLLSGSLLKRVFRGEEIQKYYCRQSETEEKKDIEFSIGSIGQSVKYKAKLLTTRKEFESQMPTIKQISKLVRGKILIQDKNPEFVLFHCVAGFQKGNYDDLLVSDGIGEGFSNKLSNALLKLKSKDDEESFIVKILKHSINQNLNENNEKQNKQNEVWKYPSISRLLQKCDNVLYTEKTEIISNKNQEIIAENKMKDAVVYLYQAVENTLRQIVEDYPADAWKSLLSSKNHNEIGKLLCGITEKLNFKISEYEKGKFSIPAGKFKTNEISVEMYPLLALCICGADDNPQHPLIKINRKYKNFFKEIYDLDTNRNTIAHGRENKKEHKWLNPKFDYFCKIIETIYPEALIFNREYSIVKEIDNTMAEAKANLYKYFGSANIHNAPKFLSQKLAKVFILQESLDEDNFIQYVIDIASCLQSAIFMLYRNKDVFSDNLPEKQECLQKITDLQFVTDIPISVQRVNQSRYTRAVQGEDVTLGANLLAVFGLLELEELKNLKNKMPDLVETTAKIAELRGHGNKNVEFSQENINITKNSLEIIKKILEE